MATIRAPAVAGTFYPGDPDLLRREIEDLLGDAPAPDPPPVALIVPHAGYDYSGPVAASAYCRIRASGSGPDRVILIGPSHHCAFTGFAVPQAGRFRTPLGDVPVDAALKARALAFHGVTESDEVHRFEHSLEVQLPFLQVRLDAFSILPIAVGLASGAQVATLLESLWSPSEALLLVSSDLSHYQDYESARIRDEKTATSIATLAAEWLREGDACGLASIQGLLDVARARGMRVSRLCLANSGDTAGPQNLVVGYGAFAFWA